MLSNTDQIVHKQLAANGKGPVYFRDCLLTQKGLSGWSNSPSMIKLLVFGQIKDHKDKNVFYTEVHYVLT